ncbi:methylated-DNA--[protein]-cysteine S-methyltransferase [Kribbella sp. NPDC055110]
MNRHAVVSTRIGELTVVVSEEDVLVGVYFPHHWVKPTAETLGERVEASDPLIAVVVSQLEEYFGGSRVSFELPTRLEGEEFQRRVWSVLEEIPYGETTTYGEIAARLGEPAHAAQAVGKAVGQNPLSIVVPCHRVIGKNGSLTGYAGGLKRKQFLLDLEEPVGARLF